MTVDTLGTEEISVRRLIDRCYAATQKMSRKNPHRLLLLQATSALMQLVKQVEPPHPPPPVDTLVKGRGTGLWLP